MTIKKGLRIELILFVVEILKRTFLLRVGQSSLFLCNNHFFSVLLILNWVACNLGLLQGNKVSITHPLTLTHLCTHYENLSYVNPPMYAEESLKHRKYIKPPNP